MKSSSHKERPRDLVSFGDFPFKKELLTLKVGELGHGGNTGDVALIWTGAHVSQRPEQEN
jgi:hypothetical protein